MSDKQFKLEIITPRRVAFSGDVVSFTAPGTMGSFQVLVNHAPLLAEIGIGEARLRDPHGNEFRFATGGGFVEVKKNHVVMLAESADRAEEINLAAAESDRDRALKEIADRVSSHDIERAKAELQVALNRIRVADKR